MTSQRAQSPGSRVRGAEQLPSVRCLCRRASAAWQWWLKHAAIYPDHEQAIGKLAGELGFSQVSLSSAVMQMVKMVPRGYTATADAYLTPLHHEVRYRAAPPSPAACCSQVAVTCARARGKLASGTRLQGLLPV